MRTSRNPDPAGEVAVLLPTRNGARTLDEVLTAVGTQRTRWSVDVFAIDSDSSDGTRDVLRKHGARVVGIARADFGHGRTRNALAEMAHEARFLVFLSQDATPLENWLDRLVGAVEADGSVAGAFSRQVPRSDANPLVARRMREEWPQVGGLERMVKRAAVGAGPSAIDHRLAHFANTSSCIRRDVWRAYPFPDVLFGEDVAWARLVLAAGYALVYEPDSAVRHSHGGTPWRQFSENVAHGRAIRTLFGPSGPNRGRPMTPAHGALDRARRDVAAILAMDRPVPTRLAWLAYAPFWHLSSLAGQWVGQNWRVGRASDESGPAMDRGGDEGREP